MSNILLEELQAALKPIFDKYGVARAFVFGSVARGEATRRSDVDLVVIQETDKPFLDRYEGILAEIHTALRRSVDLLIYTPREFEAMPRTAFVRRMLRDSKVIYERERESPDGDALDRDG
ncbi:MAG: nucleotidyltransferase domain-containing protein [Chloroflexi bacterium]|uniref:Nucleotidyltransferase domain-containing protein n=1 Tax=Candidatus Thermofonsia Clade 3 bacterium TaxID=2364212 RepID=A0A2M8QAS6_9CHLR|nr:nucleotidyltransferase domain-containing protein [Candidatus Roseilinea sp. NK_OTU-006]PJF46894.1 MAG: nucleotidyltransferase domain-containing protein [Candidatus Thermofonsia Clade 3 bacterium]RMG62320.1 MAG: nucleotidyltransferase domain-containing protein [Chloroflexota bacterium]